MINVTIKPTRCTNFTNLFLECQLRSYLNKKSSGSRSRKQRLTALGTRCADHVTPLYPQKLALTSPTGGGCSVGIVRSRTKATEFFFYSWNETLHVSDSFSIHHQESSTVHTARGICHSGYADCLRAGSGWNVVPSWSCSQAVSKPVWHIPLLCVQWKTPDDGQRNCPKHVEFHSKNKFVKLVHLVGFNIRNLTQLLQYWPQNKQISGSAGRLFAASRKKHKEHKNMQRVIR